MRIGVGNRPSVIYDLLTQAAAASAAVAHAVNRRFREWPNGPTQDEIKAPQSSRHNLRIR